MDAALTTIVTLIVGFFIWADAKWYAGRRSLYICIGTLIKDNGTKKIWEVALVSPLGVARLVDPTDYERTWDVDYRLLCLACYRDSKMRWTIAHQGDMDD